MINTRGGISIDIHETERLIYKLLADRSNEIAELAIATRAAVHKAAQKTGHDCGELIYNSYCVSDVFSFTGKLGQGFIHIATYANHVNLGFNRGSELPDPDKVLHGTGKTIRHYKLTSKSDLKTKPVKALIAAAVDQGLKLGEDNGGIQTPTFLVKSK